MQILLPTVFLLFFAGFNSLSRADDYESALSKLEGFERELMVLKNESSNIPQAELDKASEWIDNARSSLSQESIDTLTKLKIERVSYQIDFLRTLLEESRAKKETGEAAQLLQKIRYQTEEMKATNEKVKEEIERLKQK